MIKDLLKSILPEGVARRLRSSASFRALRSSKPSVMEVGQGKGLLFDPGPSNFEYAAGNNELPVQDALARSIAPGNVVFDIGANVGFLTVVAARLAGANGRVEAFEPVPENAYYVRLNVGFNHFENVIVHEVAVADTSGESEFWVARYSGGGTLAGGEPPPDPERKIRVKRITVDEEVFSGRLPAPNFVKIDVEGFEIEVLRGMQRTLKEHRPIVLVEVDDGNVEAMQDKQRICEEFLRAQGYQIEQLPNSYPETHDWHISHCLAIAPGAAS